MNEPSLGGVTLCIIGFFSSEIFLLFSRRLGVELGKSVVFQESNRGKENLRIDKDEEYNAKLLSL